MHFCGSGFCFALFFLLRVHLFSVRLVVAGAAWTIVGWSLYFFFLFLPFSTNGAGGISFFVYADAMKMKYMLLDIRTQDHGLSLGIPSETFPPPSEY